MTMVMPVSWVQTDGVHPFSIVCRDIHGPGQPSMARKIGHRKCQGQLPSLDASATHEAQEQQIREGYKGFVCEGNLTSQFHPGPSMAC